MSTCATSCRTFGGFRLGRHYFLSLLAPNVYTATPERRTPWMRFTASDHSTFVNPKRSTWQRACLPARRSHSSCTPARCTAASFLAHIYVYYMCSAGVLQKNNKMLKRSFRNDCVLCSAILRPIYIRPQVDGQRVVIVEYCSCYFWAITASPGRRSPRALKGKW